VNKNRINQDELSKAHDVLDAKYLREVNRNLALTLHDAVFSGGLETVATTRLRSILKTPLAYTDDLHGTRAQEDTGYHNTAQFHDNTSYNYHAIEFARIPEGVKVEVCEPDFYRLRSGIVECNPNSLVVIDKQVGQAGCPSSIANYSLLDCMLSVERNHPIEKLAYRPKNERMAFGSKTWYDVCRGANANNLTTEARHLCTVLETAYELRVPLASAYSRVQLVRYSFSTNYGCFGPTNVELGQRLSRMLPPNIILQCRDIEHGSHTCGLSGCHQVCPRV
jgi:hypothetical protein